MLNIIVFSIVVLPCLFGEIKIYIYIVALLVMCMLLKRREM